MSLPTLSTSAMAIVDWLAELGPRWGLPGNACRVHALLYLIARPIPKTSIGSLLALDADEVDTALAWLTEDRLAIESPDGWVTEADPWSVMMQALEARRARELGPAREILGAWWRSRDGDDPIVARQAQRLHDLVEDIAAIDAGARRLSPGTLRKLMGVGGRAARLVDRAFGRGRGT